MHISEHVFGALRVCSLSFDSTRASKLFLLEVCLSYNWFLELGSLGDSLGTKKMMFKLRDLVDKIQLFAEDPLVHNYDPVFSFL